MTFERAGQQVLDYIADAHLLKSVALSNGCEVEGNMKPVWTANAAEQIGELIKGLAKKGIANNA